MVPIQSFASGVLADAIRRQPPSAARTAFAWTVAVGPALARATTVSLEARVLCVEARDPAWAQEIQRNRETILKRLQHLLGPAIVRIDVVPRP